MEPLTADDPQEIGGIRLTGRLGTGGFGTVFLGVSSLGRWVAVKVLHLPSIDREMRQRFAREAKASLQIKSPYVAHVTEVSVSGNPPYLVSDFIPGPTLMDSRSQFRALTTDELYALAAGLAGGLRDLHAIGIIHRDIKPANIILGDAGPVLVDLGIATIESDTMITQLGQVAGTPHWMSPEQVDGLHATPASDMWAMGRCLRWVSHQHGIQLDEDNALSLLISSATQQDPKERPTPEEFLERLVGTQRLADFIAPRWSSLEQEANARKAALPTQVPSAGIMLPTRLDAAPTETPPTTLDQTQVWREPEVTPSPHTDFPYPEPLPNAAPQRSSHSSKVVIAVLALVLFLAVIAGTVVVGMQLLNQPAASSSDGAPEIPSAPTPTVTVTPESQGGTDSQPGPQVTVTENAGPNPATGGEQDLIFRLASAMNSQDWATVNSLCDPTQTCEVQFTSFFAPRYARGQWVETSFDTFYSCQGNVPFGMERGCVTPDRWVGDIYFTCFKDGSFGFQEELTSFTFTYSNGYPLIQRFDPVALVSRADECY